MKDLYKILEVEKDADTETLKKSFRNLSKLYHPDTCVDDSKKKELEEKFKEISHAYNILSDPQERAAYDRPKNQPPPFPFPPGFGGGFNPFHGFNFSFGGGAGGININNIFSQQIVSINVNISIEQMLIGGEVETDSPAGRIKFVIPPLTPPGKMFPVKINQNGKPNEQLIIQVGVHLKMPTSLTEEQKKKIKDLGL